MDDNYTTRKAALREHELFWHNGKVLVLRKTIPPTSFLVTKERATEKLANPLNVDVAEQLLYQEVLDVFKAMEKPPKHDDSLNHYQKISPDQE